MATATTGSVQTSSSGSTYITSLVSGLNTQALITAAVNAKLVKKTRLDDQITANTNKIAAYQDLQSQAASVLTALNKLRSTTTGEDKNVLTAKQVTYLSSTSTPAENILTATVDSTAQTGTHKVIVTKLATALTVTSDEQNSANDPLGYTGTFDIGETGKTASTISITVGDTLQDVASKINLTSTTSGVRADILQAADGKYKLVISGIDTAKDIDITNVTGTDVLNSLGVTDALGDYAHISQPAQQAQVSVDGTTILSDTNKITNALGGFTLELNNEVPGTTVTVTIGNNTEGVKDTIKSLILAYNTLHDSLVAYQAHNSDGTVSSGAYLYNEPLIRTLGQSISSIITSTFGGGTSYQSLGAIGLSLDSRNDFSLDETKLDAALKTNFSDVKALFSTNGSVKGLADTFYDLLDSYANTATGSIAKTITNLQTTDTSLSSRAQDIQTAADTYQQSLIEKYAKLETQISRADILKRQIEAILQGSTQNKN